MNTYKISNISIDTLRKYLEYKGAKKIKPKGGGHEKWIHSSLNRPITFQTHIDPVPELIVNQIIKYFGDSKKGFNEIINNL